jgi:uncharacterized protein (TIGR02001 family)
MRIAAWRAGLFAAVSLLGAGALSAPARADGAWGPFTANISLTTDYRFRGISQSDNDAAVQGGIDFADNGWFAGVWASTVDFLDDGPGSNLKDAPAEVDLYGGYNYAVSDTTEIGIKAIYYWYPDSDSPIPGVNHYDYFELGGHVSHTFEKFSLLGELYWSPDYFFESSDSIYLAGTATVPLLKEFWIFDGGLTASARVAYQWIDDNATFGTPDYLTWDVGLTAKAGIFAFDARYVDTDLSDSECFGGGIFKDFCGAGFVGTVTVALPG